MQVGAPGAEFGYLAPGSVPGTARRAVSAPFSPQPLCGLLCHTPPVLRSGLQSTVSLLCAPQIVTDLDGESEDDEDAPVVVELPEGVQLPD